MRTAQDVISENLDDVKGRMDAVEAFYLEARLEGRKVTSADIDALNSYVLRDDLRWSHPDKMTLIDYPFESETQRKRRDNKKAPYTVDVLEIGADGRSHRLPTRKRRSAYENWYVDHHARARNKERRRRYNAFIKTQPVVSYSLKTGE
ncbi:hypothetical protein [Shouchella clausii]|uniref:hypothetical protein n=1 Tax=Shouchella clausii TaxID=79880 RepID=UPI001652E8ED|nr:hypothetical protein [Shouchella clausii]QNM43734.1 hypothetical protein DUT88_12880 [Shouchella clausii]